MYYINFIILGLQNDLKEVMKKVELALHEFHASKK